MYKLCPPAFTPTTNTEPFGVIEIGSGAGAAEYRQMVLENSVGIIPIEVPGERPTALLRVGRVPLRDLSSLALRVQKDGVSHGVFLTLMSHEGATFDYVPPNPSDPSPAIADTWTEFVMLMRQQGIAMADAEATAGEPPTGIESPRYAGLMSASGRSRTSDRSRAALRC